MEESKSFEKNYLLWIGIGVLACLVLLTGVSVLDLRRDALKADAGGVGGVMGAVESVGQCPNCGTKSMPQCFYCGTAMKWSGAHGMFQCPSCRRVGQAPCPSCGVAMRQQHVPGAAGGAVPQRWPVAMPRSPVRRMAFHCPGCPLGTPQVPAQPAAWSLIAAPGRPASTVCPQCGTQMTRRW